MSNTSNHAGTVSPGYGAVPPLTVGTVSTVGTAGQYLINGSNGTSWTNLADNVLTAKNNPPELEVKGRMVINGRDLEERLNTIEKVLHIPERDVILEQSYPLLKQKYEDYINTLSKYRMWESIKGDK
jgi:hypothetical protein